MLIVTYVVGLLIVCFAFVLGFFIGKFYAFDMRSKATKDFKKRAADQLSAYERSIILLEEKEKEMRHRLNETAKEAAYTAILLTTPGPEDINSYN